MKNFSYAKLVSHTTAVVGCFLLSGLQEAAAVICPPDDPPPCIESTDITNGQVTASDLGTNSVTPVKIQANAVTGAKVLDRSLAAADIGGNVLGESELAENITLGRPGDDGDLMLEDSVGRLSSIILDGQTGNAWQRQASEGFVKAWAMLDFDGFLIDCHLCDPNNTGFGANVGEFVIDFSPLSSDIRDRPRSATLDSHFGGPVSGEIGISGHSNLSRIFVVTRNSDGTQADKSFTVLIY